MLIKLTVAWLARVVSAAPSMVLATVLVAATAAVVAVAAVAVVPSRLVDRLEMVPALANATAKLTMAAPSGVRPCFLYSQVCAAWLTACQFTAMGWPVTGLTGGVFASAPR